MDTSRSWLISFVEILSILSSMNSIKLSVRQSQSVSLSQSVKSSVMSSASISEIFILNILSLFRGQIAVRQASGTQQVDKREKEEYPRHAMHARTSGRFFPRNELFVWKH